MRLFRWQRKRPVRENEGGRWPELRGQRRPTAFQADSFELQQPDFLLTKVLTTARVTPW
jgi:hypothetical protein